MNSIHFILILVLILGCKNVQLHKPTAPENTTTNSIAQWLSWDGNGKMPHIVLVSGDQEYRSEEALPMLAKILSERHGFKTTVLFAQDPKRPGFVDPNYSFNIPGLEQLATADLMVMFLRFRALPDEQMKHIDDFLKSGKPLLGIRTSTHAFKFEGTDMPTKYGHYCNYYKGTDEWQDGFGRLVMGEHWIAHHGKHGDQSTKGLIAPGAKNHPLTNGIENGAIWGPTDVYGVRLPLPGDAQAIILGQTVDRYNAYDENDSRLGMRPTDNKLPGWLTQEDEKGNKISFNQNDPMMPVAWTKTYQLPGGKPGKCFSSTIGASTDMLEEGTRRLMVNAVFWGLGLEVPGKANVDIVGTYAPTRFAFYKDEHWDTKGIRISDLK
jgi:hypothetical protein